MKKYFITSLFLIFVIIFAGSTSSRQVGSGCIYYNYIDESMPVNIHILEIDLTDPNLEIITQKAGSKLDALQQTSVMAEQLEADNQKVIAAINADFFQKNGVPIGVQVADGIMIKNPFSRSVFGLTEERVPFIEVLDFDGTLFTKNDQCKINGVNSYRQDDELILFNNYIGLTNKTNKWGIEVAANYIKEPCVNDTSYLVVIDKDNSATKEGNREIPGYGVVLSAHGKKAEFLKNNVALGDTIKIMLQLNPIRGKISEAVGGTPQIIKNGRIRIETKKENIPENFSTTKHPRTAVGYNKQKTKLFFFAIDGRQEGYSRGMSLRELAKFMLDWGVYQGVNLDGGGSTTMYIRGKIVNRPSDATGERRVSNSLIVLSKGSSNTAAIVSLLPARVKVNKNSSYKFRYNIFDKYFNPLNNKKIKFYSSSPSLGHVDKNGKFTAGNASVSGYLYMQVDDKKDSSFVIIE